MFHPVITKAKYVLSTEGWWIFNKVPLALTFLLRTNEMFDQLTCQHCNPPEISQWKRELNKVDGGKDGRKILLPSGSFNFDSLLHLQSFTRECGGTLEADAYRCLFKKPNTCGKLRHLFPVLIPANAWRWKLCFWGNKIMP